MVHQDSSLIAIVKSVINFDAVFEKEHGLSFPVARMVDIVEDMASFDFLSGISFQTCQRYIRVAKFIFQHPDILIVIEDIDGGKEGGGDGF